MKLTPVYKSQLPQAKIAEYRDSRLEPGVIFIGDRRTRLPESYRAVDNAVLLNLMSVGHYRFPWKILEL